MHDAITDIAKAVRYDVCTAITTKPSERFSSVMKEYKRYGLKMTEFEVRAFAEMAAGTYTELRILQSVAANSGFKVSIPSVSDIEADIKRIEKGARVPSMYTPTEYIKEASEVLGEKPWFRDDGSVAYRSGKPDALFLALTAKSFENLEKDMSGPMLERWKGVQPIVIERLTNNEDKADISLSEREKAEAELAEAEQIAHKEFGKNLDVTPDPNESAIAAENEASAARSREILARYTRR